ncbi:MAG: sugar ABC transporter permease [Planctomycetaceae bacterium]|nr:sugar ABC transporter permease [Planctomycetaceae bacterium]
MSVSAATAVSARRVGLPSQRWLGLAPGWWFVLPALAVIGVFFLLPAVATLALSVTDFDIYALADLRNMRFVGFDNFRRILAGEQADLFWQALANTCYFVLIGGPLSVAVSLGFALLLESKLTRMKGLLRVIFFAPVVTTLVAVSITWRYLYDRDNGLINNALETLGLTRIDWLGDPRWAMPSIILLAVWKNFGYNMVIFLAGLQSIPGELYEAAALDGASPWRRFWHVTLPALGPTFLFVGVTTMIGYFQLFAEPYVMTRGGPENSTYSLVLLMYEEGFRWWRLGAASAVAVVLFVITLAAAMAQIAVQRRAAA